MTQRPVEQQTRRQALTPADLLAHAGDVAFASTIIVNDSDMPGPLVVEVRREPLTDARLVGEFQPIVNKLHLTVQYNMAVPPDGTVAPVFLYAAEVRQKSLAAGPDLDRRLFQRYTPHVATAIVSGLG